MKHTKKTTILTGTLIALFLAVAIINPSFAQSPVEVACDVAGQNCTTSNDDAKTIAETVVDLFSIAVGAVAVIMIIIGGFKFITSGGDPGKTASARGTIIYAVIGLVVVIFAQTLVKLVISSIG